jgi:hypothetical protein
MKLLVDTDAFCKLGVASLLPDAARMLGAELEECGRLPALPHMLRRGSLPRRYGKKACEDLISIAESMPVVPEPSVEWLDKMTPIDVIDPGEARILAAAAEFALAIVSGDKRALRAVKDAEGLAPALAGRVSVLEAILLGLCERLGHEDVRGRVAPLMALDKTVDICFSPGVANPPEALMSYYRSIAADVAPLVLWAPPQKDAE